MSIHPVTNPSASATAGTADTRSNTLAGIVHDYARIHPDKTALIFADQPRSYADLDDEIERAANGLAARGIGHGDRVALLLPNMPEFIVAYYAVMRRGAIVVPVNVLYKTEEIAYILHDSEATALIVFAGFAAHGVPAAAQSPSVTQVIVVGEDGDVPEGTTPWAALVDGTAPPCDAVTVAPEDLATICYTSGTTGRSKGAMLTHRNFIANCKQLDMISRACANESDIVLLVLPLFHIYAMNCALNSFLRAGATVVLIPRFEPIPVLAQMQKHRVTYFHAAPPIFVAWANLPTLADYDLSAVRAAFSGAAPLPVKVIERFNAAVGFEISEGYGLTETSPVTHTNFAGPRTKPGTIGPPIPGVEVRLVDEDDNDVPPGTQGEIICRGENVTQGYWRQPEASAEALRGGWFHTGDIATVDDEGYYTIVDRKKDMINVGGFKVWPREVEEVLFRHPAVREAAVVGAPDGYSGERPMAYVVTHDAQTTTAEALTEYCREHLATFKVPRQIVFRADLPKLPTGKVLRRVLRDEARVASERVE